MIVYTMMGIDATPDDVEACLDPRPELQTSILRYKTKLEQRGVEIFSQQDNMLATAVGYYFAFYEEDLEKG